MFWAKIKQWFAHWFRIDYSGYSSKPEKHEGNWNFEYKDKK